MLFVAWVVMWWVLERRDGGLRVLGCDLERKTGEKMMKTLGVREIEVFAWNMTETMGWVVRSVGLVGNMVSRVVMESW